MSNTPIIDSIIFDLENDSIPVGKSTYWIKTIDYHKKDYQKIYQKKYRENHKK